jgi:NDP-sugar pyrophosphorylase family protein
MLMAAGLGTRLKPFTDLEPKALMPVMGIPAAQFAIDSLVEAEVKTIVANIHHQAEHARTGLLALKRGSSDLVISDESALLLGSAGGIAKALPHLHMGPFYLLNVDVLAEVDLKKLAEKHIFLRENFGVKLTLTIFPRPSGSGKYREILLDPNSKGDAGLIQGLGDVVSGRPYFVGAAVLEPELFRGISNTEPSEFVPMILQPAIQEKKAGFYIAEGQWFDIGDPKSWLETHLKLMQGLETGSIPKNWRLRIESVNKRIAQEVWISEGARRNFKVSGIVSPSYFNHLDDTTAQPPEHLGPNAVLYGDAHSYHGEFSNRVGFRGLSEKV